MGDESRDERPRPGSLRHAPNIDTTPYRDGLMGSASCVHIDNMGTPPSLPPHPRSVFHVCGPLSSSSIRVSSFQREGVRPGKLRPSAG